MDVGGVGRTLEVVVVEAVDGGYGGYGSHGVVCLVAGGCGRW